MRLEEIKQGFNITIEDTPELSEDNSKILGTINGKYVYGTSYFKDSFTVCLIEDDSEQPVESKVIAYLILTDDKTTINGNEYNVVERIFVAKEHRGKGLATDLYLFANKKLELKIMSGNEFTKDGIHQLKRLINSNRFDIAFYNTDTKEYTTGQPEDMFSGDNEWRVLYEHNTRSIGNRGLLFGRGYRILTEYDCLDRSLGYD